jgi:hypothetical protein
MIAAAGLAVEIDPVLRDSVSVHCVIVIHEAALAVAEPFMHAASEIPLSVGYPGHENI